MTTEYIFQIAETVGPIAGTIQNSYIENGNRNNTELLILGEEISDSDR